MPLLASCWSIMWRKCEKKVVKLLHLLVILFTNMILTGEPMFRQVFFINMTLTGANGFTSPYDLWQQQTETKLFKVL